MPPVEFSDEYANGERYDAEYGGIDDDGAFFLALAMRGGRRVLDLGCGTGRVAIPLAEAGKAVTGLDGAPPMLERARAKSNGRALRGTLRWVLGDFRDYDLGERFDTALSCAHAFQGLMTADDQRRYLACVRRHLDTGGLLAFDTRNTAPVHLEVDGREQFWHSFSMPDGRIIDTSTIDRFDAAAGVVHYRVIRRDRQDGSRSETTIDIKFTDPATLTQLLQEGGFAIEAMYGDFAGGALTSTSPEIIAVARAA
jgi:SAM-dependent methyltransferase